MHVFLKSETELCKGTVMKQFRNPFDKFLVLSRRLLPYRNCIFKYPLPRNILFTLHFEIMFYDLVGFFQVIFAIHLVLVTW